MASGHGPVRLTRLGRHEHAAELVHGRLGPLVRDHLRGRRAGAEGLQVGLPRLRVEGLLGAPPLVQQSRSMCRAHMQWFQPTLRAMAAPYFARSNKGELLDPMTKTMREKGGVVVFRDSRRRRRVQKKRQQIITTHARRQVGHKRAAAFAKVVQKERKDRQRDMYSTLVSLWSHVGHFREAHRCSRVSNRSGRCACG